MPTESPKMCRKARKGFGIMGKTTRRKYDPKFKMRVALEVYKGEKTLSQVAQEIGWSAEVWDFSGETPKLK